MVIQIWYANFLHIRFVSIRFGVFVYSTIFVWFSVAFLLDVHKNCATWFMAWDGWHLCAYRFHGYVFVNLFDCKPTYCSRNERFVFCWWLENRTSHWWTNRNFMVHKKREPFAWVFFSVFKSIYSISKK